MTLSRPSPRALYTLILVSALAFPAQAQLPRACPIVGYLSMAKLRYCADTTEARHDSLAAAYKDSDRLIRATLTDQYTKIDNLLAQVAALSARVDALTVVVPPPPAPPPPPPPPAPALIARFTASGTGLSRVLDARGSTGNIVSYDWDLNKSPEGFASGALISVAYPQSGTRTVVLTVKDARGAAATTSQVLAITDGIQPPPAPPAPPTPAPPPPPPPAPPVPAPTGDAIVMM